MQYPRARGCDRADNGNQAGHILLVGVAVVKREEGNGQHCIRGTILTRR